MQEELEAAALLYLAAPSSGLYRDNKMEATILE